MTKAIGKGFLISVKETLGRLICLAAIPSMLFVFDWYLSFAKKRLHQFWANLHWGSIWLSYWAKKRQMFFCHHSIGYLY